MLQIQPINRSEILRFGVLDKNSDESKFSLRNSNTFNSKKLCIYYSVENIFSLRPILKYLKFKIQLQNYNFCLLI